jgi:hypothetical protein
VYRDAISVFLADTLSLCLALLERVLVLELGPHRSFTWRSVVRKWQTELGSRWNDSKEAAVVGGKQSSKEAGWIEGRVELQQIAKQLK